MTQNEKAIKVLESKDIQAHEDYYGNIYISIGDMDINISNNEIELQASEYDEDTHN